MTQVAQALLPGVYASGGTGPALSLVDWCPYRFLVQVPAVLKIYERKSMISKIAVVGRTRSTRAAIATSLIASKFL